MHVILIETGKPFISSRNPGAKCDKRLSWRRTRFEIFPLTSLKALKGLGFRLLNRQNLCVCQRRNEVNNSGEAGRRSLKMLLCLPNGTIPL